MICKSKDWLIKHTKGSYGKFWLGFLSMSEAIFLPIPIDAFMMGMLLIEENRKKWVYFATLTMLMSIVGAIIGYFLASYLFTTFGSDIVYIYGYNTQFESVRALLDHGIFMFMIIGAISPIPYKIFVLTAGFIKANFVIFLVASVIGRSFRLYLSAWLVYKYGDQGVKIMKRYGVHLGVIGVVLILVYTLGYIYL